MESAHVPLGLQDIRAEFREVARGCLKASVYNDVAQLR